MALICINKEITMSVDVKNVSGGEKLKAEITFLDKERKELAKKEEIIILKKNDSTIILRKIYYMANFNTIFYLL